MQSRSKCHRAAGRIQSMKNSITSIFQLPAVRSSVRHSAETLSQRSYTFSKLSVSQTIRHQQLPAETIALVDMEFGKFASHVQTEIGDIHSTSHFDRHRPAPQKIYNVLVIAESQFLYLSQFCVMTSSIIQTVTKKDYRAKQWVNTYAV